MLRTGTERVFDPDEARPGDVVSHPYGVKYPDGSFSGGIADSHRDAARYGKAYHATVYEVGSPSDPDRHDRPEAAPWFDHEDVAAAKADIANDTDKCYPSDFSLASKFGGG